MNLKSIFRVFICLAIFQWPWEAGGLNAQNQPHAWSQSVLDKLYGTLSNKRIPKPGIAVVAGKVFAARYVPLKHEIQIEKEILNICRSFKEDSSDALSFVLAHELSHAMFDRDTTQLPSYFVQSHKSETTKLGNELTSDINGLFLSFLAGYNPEKILGHLLKQIYGSYQISETENEKYPSKSERINSSKFLVHKMLGFLQLFEVANVLTLKGYYDLAAACYERILDVYKGAEIYNNLGWVYALKALEIFDEDSDYFAYLLEPDFNTGLKKFKKARGPLTQEMRLARRNNLNMAKTNFTMAITLNSDYSLAYFNFISCMLLSGEAPQALTYMNALIKSKNEFQKNPSMALLLGIANGLLSDVKAELFFQEVLKSKNEKLSMFAKHNLKIVKGDRSALKMVPESSVICEGWKISREPAPGGKSVVVNSDTLQLDFGSDKITLNIYHDKSLKVFSDFSSGGEIFLSVRWNSIDSDHPIYRHNSYQSSSQLKWMDTYRGIFVECEASGYLYLQSKARKPWLGVEIKTYN
ncbi:MAG: hypothetical protein IPM34_13570 [Saprospiraceae bacterium]|nr:hypothetical protein [Saprospiraceae bacterium]